MSYQPQSEQRGVRADKSRGWNASIYIAGRRYHLGYFQTEQEAIRARLKAEKNRDRFLGSPPRERKRRFNPFKLIDEERFFANYQSLFAYYRGRRGREAAINESLEDTVSSFEDDVEDAREMLRLKHSGAFPVR